jgi:hypothetical protein
VAIVLSFLALACAHRAGSKREHGGFQPIAAETGYQPGCWWWCWDVRLEQHGTLKWITWVDRLHRLNLLAHLGWVRVATTATLVPRIPRAVVIFVYWLVFDGVTGMMYHHHLAPGLFPKR